jgi:hypothetical protein
MTARDLIGKRGEAIVCAGLTDFCGRPLPYFDPHPLGEKCPTFDLLVELLDVGFLPAYFFAQVKATKQGYTAHSAELKAGVHADDVRKMVNCPVPTYLIGVDEPGGIAYLAPVHKRRGAISSIPTTHPLNPTNLKALWTEVRDHWKALRRTKKTSVFE